MVALSISLKAHLKGVPIILFMKAFIQIGAIECAEAIKKAIKLNELEENSEFTKLDHILYKNSEENYNKLRAYVENNLVALDGLEN